MSQARPGDFFNPALGVPYQPVGPTSPSGQPGALGAPEHVRGERANAVIADDAPEVTADVPRDNTPISARSLSDRLAEELLRITQRYVGQTNNQQLLERVRDEIQERFSEILPGLRVTGVSNIHDSINVELSVRDLAPPQLNQLTDELLVSAVAVPVGTLPIAPDVVMATPECAPPPTSINVQFSNSWGPLWHHPVDDGSMSMDEVEAMTAADYGDSMSMGDVAEAVPQQHGIITLSPHAVYEGETFGDPPVPSDEHRAFWALYSPVQNRFYDILYGQFAASGTQLPTLRFATKHAAEHFVLEWTHTHRDVPQLLTAVQIRDPWYVIQAEAVFVNASWSYRAPESVRLFSTRDQTAHWAHMETSNYNVEDAAGASLVNRRGITFCNPTSASLAWTMLRGYQHRVISAELRVIEEMQVQLHTAVIVEVRTDQFAVPVTPEPLITSGQDRPARVITFD